MKIPPISSPLSIYTLQPPCLLVHRLSKRSRLQVLVSLARKNGSPIPASNQEHLDYKAEDEDHSCHEGKHVDLDVRLDEPQAGAPVKGFPRIKHAQNTASSDNLGNDLATKATVKRDDGLLSVWEEGSLNAGQGNACGQDEHEAKHDSQSSNAETLES